MNTASLKLSKELYELSGWVSHDYCYYDKDSTKHFAEVSGEEDPYKSGTYYAPAYTLDYLIRKLPYYIDTKDARGTFELFLKKTYKEYHAGYNKPESGKWLDDNNHGVWDKVIHADTPEDACAMLAIELIKQGVIQV